MQSVSLDSRVNNRTVRFSPEGDEIAAQRLVREERRQVERYLLQSDVAYSVDRDFASQLLEKAKIIIDTKFSADLDLKARHALRVSILNKGI